MPPSLNRDFSYNNEYAGSATPPSLICDRVSILRWRFKLLFPAYFFFAAQFNLVATEEIEQWKWAFGDAERLGKLVALISGLISAGCSIRMPAENKDARVVAYPVVNKEPAEDKEGTEKKMAKQKSSGANKSQYLCGKRILPEPISKSTDIVALIDGMDAYNGGRLRAACHLLRDRYSQEDVTIGLSLAGALTPAVAG